MAGPAAAAWRAAAAAAAAQLPLLLQPPLFEPVHHLFARQAVPALSGRLDERRKVSGDERFVGQRQQGVIGGIVVGRDHQDDHVIEFGQGLHENAHRTRRGVEFGFPAPGGMGGFIKTGAMDDVGKAGTGEG